MLQVANKRWKNHTTVSEFILLGLGDVPEWQILLFLVFLVAYLLTMAGNLLIFMLVVADRHLHTPMYFFLGNLSFLESCCSSTIVAKMLSNLWTGAKSISVHACFIQFSIYACMGGAECYLLAMMSYDKFLAICKPLHYATLSNGRMNVLLAAVSWVSGILVSLTITSNVLQLSFCGPNEIDHYFCDVIPDIRYISCSDTYLVEVSSFLFTCIFTLPPFALTVASYVFIIITILRIPSTTGRKKTFSTCSSHLTVVTLYYGTLTLVYVLPRSKKLRHVKKVFSLFYTVLTPMVNPFIYSLRNREVKVAIKRFLEIL